MDLLTEFFKKKVKIPHFPTHICLMVFCVCVWEREREGGDVTVHSWRLESKEEPCINYTATSVAVELELWDSEEGYLMLQGDTDINYNSGTLWNKSQEKRIVNVACLMDH